MDRERGQLLQLTIKQLNNHYNRRAHYNTYSPALAAHRVKAIFKNEPGEGIGVARSFYTAFTQVSISRVTCRSGRLTRGSNGVLM